MYGDIFKDWTFVVRSAGWYALTIENAAKLEYVETFKEARRIESAFSFAKKEVEKGVKDYKKWLSTELEKEVEERLK